MVRAHYKQKSGTELYQELITMCLSPKGTPEDFLIRALDLRQQILFASQAEDATVKYESSLVTSDDKHGLLVLFLISTEVLDHPVIGYNVTEEIVRNLVS